MPPATSLPPEPAAGNRAAGREGGGGENVPAAEHPLGVGGGATHARRKVAAGAAGGADAVAPDADPASPVEDLAPRRPDRERGGGGAARRRAASSSRRRRRGKSVGGPSSRRRRRGKTAGGLKLPTTAARQDGGATRRNSSRRRRPRWRGNVARRSSSAGTQRRLTGQTAVGDGGEGRARRGARGSWRRRRLATGASSWLLGGRGRRRSGLRRRRLASVATVTAAVAVDGGDVGGCGLLARWLGVRQQRLRWRSVSMSKPQVQLSSCYCCGCTDTDRRIWERMVAYVATHTFCLAMQLPLPMHGFLGPTVGEMVERQPRQIRQLMTRHFVASLML
uniref:B1340F09.16 protein n=1 Tax=Oryza sativa subsp. japonica TaxID=39947 RepID=Q7XP32_ORYSJ|nr:OSJNBa0027H09.7 [Oryza sativa Japonica Group]CAE76078.1 B1340F09.16 [Oryza sativa Japonica Group]